LERLKAQEPMLRTIDFIDLVVCLCTAQFYTCLAL
jgi:hypothetical protein